MQQRLMAPWHLLLADCEVLTPTRLLNYAVVGWTVAGFRAVCVCVCAAALFRAASQWHLGDEEDAFQCQPAISGGTML